MSVRNYMNLLYIMCKFLTKTIHLNEIDFIFGNVVNSKNLKYKVPNGMQHNQKMQPNPLVPNTQH